MQEHNFHRWRTSGNFNAFGYLRRGRCAGGARVDADVNTRSNGSNRQVNISELFFIWSKKCL